MLEARVEEDVSERNPPSVLEIEDATEAADARLGK